MAEEITFTVPLAVGDIDNQITIDRLRVVALSFNRQASHEAAGTVVLSVVLEHPGSTWTHNVVYIGAEALTLARLMNTADFSIKSLHTRILQKLLADGKIPAGTVSGVPQ